ncbi:hypothetical protein A2387_02880 [Candidatus Nomurabacteria bacterium RIFOXYB1_FULL_36_10]|nr:MAG: hypothetical protein A2387_02880 [Candidatus Nomurabacteria bacterium RIFOXYB1_FULL_36_10]
MKKITEIYKEYNIMPMLAMHQMRVAGVAMQICEALDVEVDKESVIKACLLHDMGNIIKFKLEQRPEWNEPLGTAYWQGVKDDFILKYGNDEHHASLEIAKELGLSTSIYDLINCIDASVAEKIVIEDDFNKKICAYVDNRVSPHGVVSVEEHSLDAKKRYEDHPHAFDEEKRIFFNKNLFEIENQIFSHTKIKPEDINDESIVPYLEKLQDFSI